MADTAYVPRLREQFDKEIRGKLTEQFGYANIMQVPRLDKVVVLSGRDKGRTGEVFEVRPDASVALVRGVNLVKRHQKQTQAQEGGIISKEAPIHLSNIAIVGKDGKPTRVGFKIQADGTKVRIAKRSGAEIDG